MRGLARGAVVVLMSAAVVVAAIAGLVMTVNQLAPDREGVSESAAPDGADAEPPGPPRWATWSRALLLIALVTALRLVYNAWLTPWELVGDEAYYWVQAYRLNLGYSEKGPLLAWMIAAACAVFGDTEWAVRLPVVLANAAAAWGVGRVAMSMTRGDQRVGFFAVLGYLMLPAFAANAQICTQDGPMIVLWIALTAVGLRLLRRWRRGEGVWGEWAILWALIGV